MASSTWRTSPHCQHDDEHPDPVATEVDLAHIAGIRTPPAFKGQWVIYVTDRRHMEYVSATSRRDALLAAEERLQLLLGRQN